MALILPQEAQEHAGVWEYLNELLAGDNPIADLRVFDLRESMANGGGPACLRLRVVLTAEEYQAVNPHVLMNDTLFATLNDWVDRYYRDRLTQADLADPQLLREGRDALDRLTQILQLGSVYPFQQCCSTSSTTNGQGKAKVDQCSVGGAPVGEKIAAIMGVEARGRDP